MNIATATKTVNALVAIMRSTVTRVFLPNLSFDVVFGVYLTPSQTKPLDVNSVNVHKKMSVFLDVFGPVICTQTMSHILCYFFARGAS